MKSSSLVFPLFEISLAQWSLHRTILNGKLDNLDFAETSKNIFGINGVEYVNRIFFDKTVPYFKEMKKRSDDAGVVNLLLMCDDEGRLGDPDESLRNQTVQNHFRWLEAAKILGCRSIRVNAASDGSYEDQMEFAADGLRKLSERADNFGLNVLVENHGGLSSNGKWLADVIRLVNHPRCGTLPDFGNFRLSKNEYYDRYNGVEEMMPFAKAVSAKSWNFDSKGNETEIDFYRMIKIVLNAGYRGYLGIEYEGNVLSEHDGIIATKKLLEKVKENFLQENLK
ncbi:MAG: sugar phosphate isomerase/epimerase family protein [Ignavibacteriaceae bacterium]